MKTAHFLTITLLFAVSVIFAATPPALINYQGVLRDAAGAPQDGDFTMTFRFYDDETPDEPEDLLLTDAHSTVTVDQGLFSVQLGSGTITTGSEPNLAEMFRDKAVVWLEVQIAPDLAPMSPRVRVLASAYAQNASSLQGVVNVDGSGRVGIGTASPVEGVHLLDKRIYITGTDPTIAFNPTGSTATVSSPFAGKSLTFEGQSGLMFKTYSGLWTEQMRISTAGNLGVGNTNPTYKLDVTGDARVTGAFRDSSGDAGISGQVLQSTASGTNWVNQSSLSDGDWTVSGNNMYSAVSGNVGIGTASPSATLDVQGTVHMFGAWETKVFGDQNQTLTGTAPSDGFLVASISVLNDGGRGYIVGSTSGTERATASVHFYTPTDAWITDDSFTLPVRKGESYQVECGTSAGSVLFTVYWIPLGHAAGARADSTAVLSPPTPDPGPIWSTPAAAAVPPGKERQSKDHAAESRPGHRPLLQYLPATKGIEPGDVLVMNPANGDELYPCNLPADPMVVGIAAGGEFRVQNSEFGDGAGGAWLPASSFRLPRRVGPSFRLPTSSFRLPGRAGANFRLPASSFRWSWRG